MAKHQMTDAAAKRITEVLGAAKGGRITIEMVHDALRAEDFSGFTRLNVQNLIGYWLQEISHEHMPETHAYLIGSLADRYAFEYYEQREGIGHLKAGLERLGIIPYPEDD